MSDNLPDVLPDEDTPKPDPTLPPAESVINPTGVPSRYSPELFERICNMIESGMSLRQSCNKVGIPKGSFLNWTKLGSPTLDRYARAQEMQADAIFDRMKERSNQLQDRDDWLEWAKRNGVEAKLVTAIINGLDKGLGRDLDIIKRISPDRYGDRLETINRNLSISYVVSFGSQGQEQPTTVIDIPMLDITPQSRPNHDKRGGGSGSKAKTRASVQPKPNKGGKVGQTKKKGAG